MKIENGMEAGSDTKLYITYIIFEHLTFEYYTHPGLLQFKEFYHLQRVYWHLYICNCRVLVNASVCSLYVISEYTYCPLVLCSVYFHIPFCFANIRMTLIIIIHYKIIYYYTRSRPILQDHSYEYQVYFINSDVTHWQATYIKLIK